MKRYTQSQKIYEKPWCLAPWITSYDSADGNINACCEWKGEPLISNSELKNITYQQRFTHPNVEKLKNNFKQKILTQDMQDQRMKSCKHCIVSESQGITSLRQTFDKMYAYNEDKLHSWYDENKFTLKYVDHRESNLCNMSCKMCGSKLSSTHAQIQGLYTDTNGILFNPHTSDDIFENLDFIEDIAFLGGEPLLTSHFYNICQKLIDIGISKNININIVTNGSILSSKMNQNVLEILDNFKSIHISISIDAINHQHDYWRHKNTWDKVYDNTLKFNNYIKNNDKFYPLKIRCAIGWPTAYAARNVFDLFYKKYNINVENNTITSPEWFSLNLLPEPHIDRLIEHWKLYPKQQQIFEFYKTKTLPLTQFDKDLANNFIGVITKYDNYHKNNFCKAFPEFTEYYNYIMSLATDYNGTRTSITS